MCSIEQGRDEWNATRCEVQTLLAMTEEKWLQTNAKRHVKALHNRFDRIEKHIDLICKAASTVVEQWHQHVFQHLLNHDGVMMDMKTQIHIRMESILNEASTISDTDNLNCHAYARLHSMRHTLQSLLHALSTTTDMDAAVVSALAKSTPLVTFLQLQMQSAMKHTSQQAGILFNVNAKVLKCASYTNSVFLEWTTTVPFQADQWEIRLESQKQTESYACDQPHIVMEGLETNTRYSVAIRASLLYQWCDWESVFECETLKSIAITQQHATSPIKTREHGFVLEKQTQNRQWSSVTSSLVCSIPTSRRYMWAVEIVALPRTYACAFGLSSTNLGSKTCLCKHRPSIGVFVHAEGIPTVYENGIPLPCSLQWASIAPGDRLLFHLENDVLHLALYKSSQRIVHQRRCVSLRLPSDFISVTPAFSLGNTGICVRLIDGNHTMDNLFASR